MTKKQKRTLVRILAVLAAFVVLQVLHHQGIFEEAPPAVEFICWFAAYLVIGYDVIWRAARNIAHGQVFDENFLMMLATFAAFGLGAFGDGQYSEALAVMLFYQVGELFQSIAVGRSRQSITDLMSIAPEYANKEVDGEIQEADPEDVHVGDIIVVRPGEKVPLDGKVLSGSSFLDTAALTGESVPRQVEPGDLVISGCINSDSPLRIQVEKEYEDSTVAKILDLVENASSKKARLENFITRFARIYTPVVTIGAVALAVLLPLVFGFTWAEGIRRACNFLIVSCPCALVISVPLGFFGGIGAASKIGVLVKGGNFLEAAGEMTTVVMDKTGTLTKGEFRVRRVLPAGEASVGENAAQRLLEMAAHGESYSTHPIARSIQEAYGKTPDLSRVGEVNEEAGHGICTTFDGKELLLGNERLLSEHGIAHPATDEAGTVVYAAYDGQYAGCIVIADAVKDDVREAIAQMKEAGIRQTVMLTGDRRAAAEAVAREVGIDTVYAELLPADKVKRTEALLQEMQQRGRNEKLGFVGDGINDAPVLMRADVGFAMGSLGSDAAIEAADIVIMDDDLRKIPRLCRIARKTMRIVRLNVVFAISVKLLILMLSIFGQASMWAAVFADVGVAVICILNSMRALYVRV